MNSTKKICITGLMIALYCALSAMIKFTIIGHIQIDLGYIVLAIACILIGPWAAIVGDVGCAFESMMFSSYGFSISWFVANVIIGLICGFGFQKYKDIYIRCIIVIVSTAIGMLLIKTLIECNLYHIPFEVKIIKSAAAFILDSICMIFGLILFDKKINTWYNKNRKG